MPILTDLSDLALSVFNGIVSHFLYYWSPYGIYSLAALIATLIVGLKLGLIYDYPQLNSATSDKTKLFWIFPRHLLSGKGLWQDIFFTLFNLILSLLFFHWGLKTFVDPMGFGFTMIHKMTNVVGMTLPAYATAENSLFVDIVYVFVVLIASNFGSWVSHYLMHRVPFFWEFHKVHHSATQLTGFTNDRVHFFEMLFSIWSAGFCMMLAVLIFQVSLGVTPSGYANPTAFLIYAAVISPTNFLLHSPYWISFGRFEFLVTSPAMHAIHHSSNSKDFNKNFSTGISLFDILFGTFQRSSTKPPIDFKIGLEDDFDWENSSMWQLVIQPFAGCFSKLRSNFLSK